MRYNKSMTYPKAWLGGLAIIAGIGFLGFVPGNFAAAQSVSPLAPSGVSVSLTPPFSVAISWSAPVASTTPITGYYVYRNGATVANVAGTSFNDTVPSAGFYSYAIAAHDANGNAFSRSASVSVSVVADTTPPTAPTGLTVSSLTSSSIALSWNAATDNVGVVGYNVVRRNNLGAAVTIPVTATSYTDSGLSPNTAYSYHVVAYDAAGNDSGASNVITVTTLPLSFVVSTPYNLTATAVSTSGINVSWNASMDVSGTPEYYLFRNGALVVTTTATSYNDGGLNPGTVYWYYAIAVDPSSQNSSGESNMSQTSTLPLPVAIISSAVTATTTTSVATSSPVVTAPSSVSTAPAVPAAALSATLFYGIKNAQVTALQAMLIQKGFLGSQYATGFFGLLTEKAVRDFQCAQSIVCSGTPATTGWGVVGPKTRKALAAG